MKDTWWDNENVIVSIFFFFLSWHTKHKERGWEERRKENKCVHVRLSCTTQRHTHFLCECLRGFPQTNVHFDLKSAQRKSLLVYQDTARATCRLHSWKWSCEMFMRDLTGFTRFFYDKRAEIVRKVVHFEQCPEEKLVSLTPPTALLVLLCISPFYLCLCRLHKFPDLRVHGSPDRKKEQHQPFSPRHLTGSTLVLLRPQLSVSLTVISTNSCLFS